MVRVRDFRRHVEETFEKVMVEFEENSRQIQELEAKLAPLRHRDAILNEKACTLGELLGINDLELARQSIVARHRGNGIAGEESLA